MGDDLGIGLLAPAGERLAGLTDGVGTSDWSRLTPAGLNVRDVLDHVVAGNVFAVRLLAGASAAEATAGLDGDQLGADARTAVVDSCARQLAAFASADRVRALHHPSGDISFATFLRFRLGELVVHGWDVAVGTEQDPALDAAVVDGLWAMVEPHVDEMRAMGTFGDGASPELPADSPVLTRLLDAFGRRI
ncbi:TIGR03086 family metal-binding protein [Kribbella sp. NPDC054772]